MDVPWWRWSPAIDFPYLHLRSRTERSAVGCHHHAIYKSGCRPFSRGHTAQEDPPSLHHFSQAKTWHWASIGHPLAVVPSLNAESYPLRVPIVRLLIHIVCLPLLSPNISYHIYYHSSLFTFQKRSNRRDAGSIWHYQIFKPERMPIWQCCSRSNF